MKRGDFYWPAMPEPDNQDLYSKPYPTEEFLDDWLVRTCEIIDKYQPALLYFDWWIQHEAFKGHLKKLIAYYYNRGEEWGKRVAVCYKHDALSFGTGIVEVERGAFADVKAFPWQTDTAVARNSWCYTDTLDYKSSREIIATLIDVVSKNGNLLLNIGPKADGSIPDGDRKILTDLAAWMKVNGEAIKESRVWRKAKEGPTEDFEGQFGDGKEKIYSTEDFRFTAKCGAVYAFAMNYPENGKVCIKSFKKSPDQNVPEFHGIIKEVRILGFDEKIDFDVTTEGLEFTTKTVKSDFPVVIKVVTA
jgi:alpha-L-fucosidase